MGTFIKVLIVEDSKEDALLILHELQKTGYDPISERVETEEAFLNALARQTWDLIISDYRLPQFSGLNALLLKNKSEIDLPFIIVSGTIGEELAVEAMRAGANDYVMKNNLQRLGSAIQRELREAEIHRKRREAEKEIRKLTFAIEQSIDGIAVSDLEFSITYANRAFTEIYGYSPKKIIGMKVTDLNSPEQKKLFEESKNHIKTKGFWQGALPQVRSDGTPFPAYTSVTLLRNEDETPIAVLIIVKDITNQKKMEILINEQMQQIILRERETIFAMSKLAESRDPETGRHLDRIRHYSKILANCLRQNVKYAFIIDDKLIENIYSASPLHDIGKVGIPDQILLKPGKLSNDEFEIMKKHSLIGAETLKEVDKKYPGNSFLQIGIQVAEFHHEKWDGSGYPHGLEKTDIPLVGRILALADCYDALTSKRPYKDAFSHEISRKIIKDDREKYFDPDIVDAFFYVEEDFLSVKDRFTDESEDD